MHVTQIVELQINVLKKHNVAFTLSLVSLLKSLSVPSQITRLDTNTPISWILHLNLCIMRVYQVSSGKSGFLKLWDHIHVTKIKHDNTFQTDWHYMCHKWVKYWSLLNTYQLLLVIMHKEILWISLFDTMNSFFWLLYFPTMMVWNGEMWQRQVT